jgi:hypothetical protein
VWGGGGGRLRYVSKEGYLDLNKIQAKIVVI